MNWESALLGGWPMVARTVVAGWLSVRSTLVPGIVKGEPALLLHRREFLDEALRRERSTERAGVIILRVLREAEGISPDPQADVIVVELIESSVNLRARWWTDSRIADGLDAQDVVLTRAKRELLAAGIDLPFPTRQILFHDQTVAWDGDRRRQREGWPGGPGPVPEPRSQRCRAHHADDGSAEPGAGDRATRAAGPEGGGRRW